MNKYVVMDESGEEIVAEVEAETFKEAMRKISEEGSFSEDTEYEVYVKAATIKPRVRLEIQERLVDIRDPNKNRRGIFRRDRKSEDEFADIIREAGVNI